MGKEKNITTIDCFQEKYIKNAEKATLIFICLWLFKKYTEINRVQIPFSNFCNFNLKKHNKVDTFVCIFVEKKFFLLPSYWRCLKKKF